MRQTPFALVTAGMTAGLLLAASTAFAVPSQADKTFAMKAAQGGLAEVQDGQLASLRAVSPQVKQFGQRMVTDHSQANQDLQQIAQQENLDLPTQASTTQQSQDRRFSGMSGADFDKSYVGYEVKVHQEDAAVFRREAQSGKDPALKGFAQKYLPMIQHHLQMAQALNNP
jgi:putative membrane protein